MTGAPLFDTLREAAARASAITLRADLIAASALPGDARQLVFPPTFMEIGHLVSPVREDGSHEYVLIDSTQSWANRLEEVADDPALGLPRIEVAVGDTVLSAYRLPHRVYDAILRDSTLAGVPYRETPLGKALVAARADDATTVLQHAPTVLLFGAWDSFGGIKVGAAKWPAALAGQIFGFDATLAKKAGVRVDPLGITLDHFQGFKAADPAQFWTANEADAARDDKGKPVVAKPSEVGHGNIVAQTLERGAWVGRIELRASLSLTRLRRYRFPVAGKASADADLAGRTLLACLAVRLLAERLERGLDLRAGADLDVTAVHWSLRQGLKGDTPVEISAEAAAGAWEAAVAAARKAGLPLAADVRLTATDKLLGLVEQAGAEA